MGASWIVWIVQEKEKEVEMVTRFRLPVLKIEATDWYSWQLEPGNW